MKIYHMIIAREWQELHGDTSTRKEWQSVVQGAAPDGWVCVGVCGYHEEQKTYRVNYVDGHDLKYKTIETNADNKKDAIRKVWELDPSGDFDHQILEVVEVKDNERMQAVL